MIGADQGIRVIALGLGGRRDDARGMLREMTSGARLATFKTWSDFLFAWLDGRVPDMLSGHRALSSLRIMEDPEAIFQQGWLLCDVGEHDRGLGFLEQAVAKGYYVAPTLRERHHFDALRDRPAFQALLARAEGGRRQTLDAFRESGGERLLGATAQPQETA
jgi:hypothetical protein